MNGDEEVDLRHVLVGNLGRIEALCRTDLSDLRRLILQTGPLGAVRSVLGSGLPSPGFEELRHRARLDLSVEAMVIRPRYRTLFIDEDVATAEWRLRENGFDVDGFLANLDEEGGR